MEKLLNARIFEYLTKFASLSTPYQPGFQQNHSTVTQLCFLVHQWHMALEEGANVQSVFLDLSKAYDRVSINALLSKLSLIGFNNSALEWFANFLHRRKQCVQLTGASSKWQILNSGILQGTVLGPVLFLINIKDLPQSTRNQCSIFADHTSLHTACKSTASSCATLIADLDAAATWADRRGNAVQCHKEQTSFDRKDGKVESTCVNERGSHPTSPHPQTSWASAQRIPHRERLYFQRIYRLCPNDWDPATTRQNHSFTSNEEDLHRSHPPSHGMCVRSVELERRTHRMSPTPTRLIWKKTLIVTASSWEEVWIPCTSFIF